MEGFIIQLYNQKFQSITSQKNKVIKFLLTIFILFLCSLLSGWLLASSSSFGSWLFGSSLCRRSLSYRLFSSRLLSSFLGRRLLCSSWLFNTSLLGSKLFSSRLFGSSFLAFSLLRLFSCWLLNGFWLLCNRLLNLGSFRLLLFLGLVTKLVASSSLLSSSCSHLESTSSYTLLQSCSHMHSGFGGINLIVSTDILENGLPGAPRSVLHSLDGLPNHNRVGRMYSWGLGFLDNLLGRRSYCWSRHVVELTVFVI